jgi:HAMP domain-containing protein
VKRLFAPAMALMNRLRYPQKFVIVSLVFALPLTLVTYFWIAELNDRIEFSQKEFYGDVYLRPLRKLLEHVPQHAMLADGLLAGRVSVRRGDLLSRQMEIDADFRALDEVDRRLGTLLGTTERLRTLAANWQDLREKLPRLEPAESEELHRKLVADVRALTSHVGDTSNLILDPDLDSYYLMDAVLLKLPEGVDLLAQLRTLGDGVLARRTLTPGEKSHLTVLGGLVRANLEALRTGLATAFRNNPSRTVRPALAAPLEKLGTTTDRLLEILDKDIVNAREVPRDPAAFEAAGARTLDASFAMWDETVVALDGLIQARIDGFARRKTVLSAVAAGVLLLAVYLWMAFYLAVTRTVSSLDAAAKRIAAGDLERAVPTLSRDEVGELGRGLEAMRVELKRSYEAIEDTVESRTRELREQTATVELLQTVATAANQAATVEEAFQIALDRVCAHTGWPLGHAYLLADDAPDELVSTRL